MHKTALIPIDIQRGFDLPPWGRRNNPGMESRGLRLLQAWRCAGQPIFHVRHDSIAPASSLRPGQIGNAFRPGFEPLDDEPVIAKSVNCAFIGTDLELRLRRARIDRLVLFGISTDMCVSTTARVASNLGFETLVVGDACFCFDQIGVDGRNIAAEALHDAHLATLHAEFAQVLDTDSALRLEGIDESIPALTAGASA
jgi:nicotinamidase-related amidase